MTNANMKLVSLSVTLNDHLETPEQELDDGEHITVRVVEVDKLLDELNGKLARSLSLSRFA
jgi:ADP-ribose pyrophosphatase